MLKLTCIILLPLLIYGCATLELTVGPDGRIQGEYRQKMQIQQIDFYKDGRVKSIQYWKTRPRTTGWSISF